MSTATSSTKKQPGQHRGDAGNTTAVNRSAAEQIIDERIEEARRALWWSEITRAVLKIAIGSMAALLAWLVLDHWIYSPGMSIRVLAFAAFLGVVIWYFVRHTWPLMTQQVTSEYAAWALENDHPDYRQQLTSYVTLKPESPRGVRARVVQAIGTRAATLLKTHDVLPGEATGTFKWWIAAASLFALLAAYIVASPKSSVASTQRLVAPFASIAPAKRVAISNVTPGNTQTLAGRSVAISAEVKGLFTGEAVTCRVLDAAKETTLAMEFDEATDRFKTSLAIEHTAVGQQQYWIEACDAVAGPFQIAIENVPVVAIERVRYQPPAYTDTQPRTTSSPAIQALDATTVTIHARVNRPVARAEMQLNCKTIGDSLRATGGITKMQIAEDGVTLTAGLILRSAVGRPNAVEPVNYRIQVWDQSEQTNPDPIVYPIKVIPDLPPDVTIVVPRKSPKEVPDNSQQTIEVHAMDADFELERVQLKLVRGLDTLAEPVIWKRESNGKGNQVAVFRFRPFLYRLRPGDVVRVTATAIDNRNIPGDPRIRPNTVTTDPVELRIVEDDPNLPQDPTDNDGLSTPDKQPASDVNQSEAGEGQSSSGSGGEGGESGGEQSGNSGSSGGESSGESSAENQPNNENPESNGQPDQNPSDGNESDGDEKQSSGESGSGNEPTGNPSGSEGKGEASSNPQDPSSAQQPNRETNSDQSSSDQTGEGEADPNGQPSPNGESDPQGQGQSSANEATPPGQSDNSQSSSDGGTKMSGSDTETGSESNSADGLQSPEGSQQPDGSQQDGSSGESDSSGKSAPEHDGEAFERIKDYLERQKNKPQSDGKQPSSPQSDSASGQESDAGKQPGEQGDQPSSQQGKQESTGSESSAGDQSTSGENSQGGESGSENGSESGSDAGSESGSDAGQETGGEESGSESGSETGSDAGGQSDSKTGTEGTNSSESADDASGDSDTGAADGEGDDSPTKQHSGQPQDSEIGPEGQPNNSDQSPTNQNRPGDPSKPNSSNPNSSPNNTSNSNSPSSSPNGQMTNGDGTGDSPLDDTGVADPPPPPDLDYAKKATDMVLDYLDENRDQIDNDLLEELNWSAEDLERFRKRWENVRDIDQPATDPNQSEQLKDALKSLGLRPSQSTNGTAARKSDGLRSINDSGNRRRVPASLREAFEAFQKR